MFLQLEKLTCPLLYIVGEDDLSASSMDNANLVHSLKSHFFPYLSNKLSLLL